jgi:hypothetical protein
MYNFLSLNFRCRDILHLKIDRGFLLILLYLIMLSVPEIAPVQAELSTAGIDKVLGLPPSNGPVRIKTSFNLHNINNIDDENETFEFTGVLVLTWHDKRQAFDPNIEMVNEKIYQGDFQFNEISPAWYPQVILKNEAGLFERNSVLLRILPDGTSILSQTINAIAKVKLDMRQLPFDSQQLDVIFEIFGFDSSQVIFDVNPSNSVFYNNDLKIPQWRLKNASAEILISNTQHAGMLGSASNLSLKFNVKRKSLFMLRLIVLPLAVIVALSWSVFWMDRSSLGDRINVSFIGILTAVAYQVVVADKLPHNSYITLINSFVNISFITMSLGVVMNVIVGEYDKKGLTEIGNKIDLRCRKIFPLIYFGLLLLSVFIFILF